MGAADAPSDAPLCDAADGRRALGACARVGVMPNSVLIEVDRSPRCGRPFVPPLAKDISRIRRPRRSIRGGRSAPGWTTRGPLRSGGALPFLLARGGYPN